MKTGQEQNQTPLVRCPRCGGLMRKPTGGSFYWHADNNHPPCEITNLADIFIKGQVAEEYMDEPLKQTDQR